VKLRVKLSLVEEADFEIAGVDPQQFQRFVESLIESPWRNFPTARVEQKTYVLEVERLA
jgi:hypothetical protein